MRVSEIRVKRIRVNQGLVSLLLALEATEPVPEPVTQMALELINNHLISVQQKIYRNSSNRTVFGTKKKPS